MIRWWKSAPWTDRAGISLLVLVLAGYPIFASVFGLIGSRAGWVAQFYRATVFAFALVVLMLAAMRRDRGSVDWLLLLFFAMYALRLLNDWFFESAEGADTAILFLIVVTVIPAVAVMMTGAVAVPSAIAAFVLMCAGNIVVVCAIVGYVLGLGHNPWADHGAELNRMAFEGLNPIAIGHVSGMALISAVYLLFATVMGPWRRGFVFFCFLVGSYGILLANSRGPIVAVVFALAVFVVGRIKRLIYIIPVLALLPLVVSTDGDVVQRFIERFTDKDITSQSDEGRLVAQEWAWRSFLEHPLFGSHFLDPVLGSGNYPHNLFYDTAMSLGVVGLAVLTILLLRAAYRGVTFYRRDYELFSLLLVQQFIAVQLSGTIYGLDAFFMLLGLCLTAVPRRAVAGSIGQPRPDAEARLLRDSPQARHY